VICFTPQTLSQAYFFREIIPPPKHSDSAVELFSYGYKIHFYGPYSEALQSDVDLLEHLNLVEVDKKQTQLGDVCYVIRATARSLPDVTKYREAIGKLSRVDPVVLELAATYQCFRELEGSHQEAIVRLRRKKGSKCNEGREDRALELISELGLQAE
jgi:uncharacterized protein YwgA